MKTTTVNIRISNILKDQIEEFAIENDQSISEATRSIIESYFNKTSDLIDDNAGINAIEPNGDLDLLQTLGFTELVFWIYDKRFDTEINESNEYYLKMIDTISKFDSHPLFTDEIVKEFNKISTELKLYLSDSNYDEFYFPQPDNPFSFNYDLFNEFFHGVRYDEDNNRVLTIQ